MAALDAGIKPNQEIVATLADIAQEKTKIAYCIFAMNKEGEGRKATYTPYQHSVKMKDDFPDDAEIRAKCDEKAIPPSFKALQAELLEVKAAYFVYEFNWMKDAGQRNCLLLVKFLGDNTPSSINMPMSTAWETMKKTNSSIGYNLEANGDDEIEYKNLLDEAKLKKTR